MRAVAAGLMLTTVLAAQTSVTTPAKRKTTAAVKSRTTTAARPMANDSKTNEGMAAVGTMPAVTGTAANLFALRYIDTKIGDGEEARPSMPPDKVVFYTVHYTGWTTDGNKFDSSVDRGEPIVFPIGVKRVITGWDTGFEGMRVGGRRRLIIPWQLAYGAAGHPPAIPEKADLIFDVELVGQGSTPAPVTGTHFDPPPAAAGTADPAKPAEKQ